MRFSVVVSAVVVVVIVGVVAWLTLRSESPVAVPQTPSDEASQASPGSGQFFQEIPPGALDASVSPEASATPLVSSTTPAAAPAAVTISMSDVGFSPAAVTVKAGTKVTFVNNGQAAHWPASDPHPTHSLLPGFDAKRGLSTGETYAYTFDTVGTWGCHDHLMSKHTCTIVVSE